MEAILVDTDVASFLFRRDTRAELYRRHLSGKLVVLSFMSLGEMYRWAEERNWGKPRRQQLEQHLRNFVTRGFSRELCRTWARVMAQAKRNGHELENADGWVAATAVLHNIPLVTHNARHYRGVDGLKVICGNGRAGGEAPGT